MSKPTILDVAQLAGVSPSTVSRYLNGSGRVSGKSQAAIREAMEKLGYRPDTTARAMRTGRTYSIVVLVPDMANPYFVEIANAVERYVAPQGYSVIVCNTDEDPDRERTLIEAVVSRNVDGLIIIPSNRTAANIVSLAQDVPVVVLDRPQAADLVFTVAGDNLSGGKLAATHLLELGHRSIAFLSGPPTIPTHGERYRGFREALDSYGVAMNPGLFWAAEASVKGGEEGVDRALSQGAGEFTAIVASSDLLAIGAMRALRARGINVPEDVSVVGYDNIALSEYVFPSLTTIDQSKQEMGRLAAEMLLAHLESQTPLPASATLLPPRLVVRSTSCPRREKETAPCGQHVRPVVP